IAHAPQHLRVVIRRDHVPGVDLAAPQPAEGEPEDASDDGKQHDDEYPDGLRDTSMPRRRLHGAVDDAVHPEHYGQESADDQYSRHASSVGPPAMSGLGTASASIPMPVATAQPTP